jgi:hypothetical protein
VDAAEAMLKRANPVDAGMEAVVADVVAEQSHREDSY